VANEDRNGTWGNPAETPNLRDLQRTQELRRVERAEEEIRELMGRKNAVQQELKGVEEYDDSAILGKLKALGVDINQLNSRTEIATVSAKTILKYFREFHVVFRTTFSSGHPNVSFSSSSRIETMRGFVSFIGQLVEFDEVEFTPFVAGGDPYDPETQWNPAELYEVLYAVIECDVTAPYVVTRAYLRWHVPIVPQFSNATTLPERIKMGTTLQYTFPVAYREKLTLETTSYVISQLVTTTPDANVMPYAGLCVWPEWSDWSDVPDSIAIASGNVIGETNVAIAEQTGVVVSPANSPGSILHAYIKVVPVGDDSYSTSVYFRFDNMTGVTDCFNGAVYVPIAIITRNNTTGQILHVDQSRFPGDIVISGVIP
jgi:uncharacterized protein (UPF0335 family)